MIELLKEYGLTEEEIEKCEKQYGCRILQKAVNKAPFKTKECLRQALKIVLKHYRLDIQ